MVFRLSAGLLVLAALAAPAAEATRDVSLLHLALVPGANGSELLVSWSTPKVRRLAKCNQVDFWPTEIVMGLVTDRSSRTVTGWSESYTTATDDTHHARLLDLSPGIKYQYVAGGCGATSIFIADTMASDVYDFVAPWARGMDAPGGAGGGWSILALADQGD